MSVLPWEPAQSELGIYLAPLSSLDCLWFPAPPPNLELRGTVPSVTLNGLQCNEHGNSDTWPHALWVRRGSEVCLVWTVSTLTAGSQGPPAPREPSCLLVCLLLLRQLRASLLSQLSSSADSSDPLIPGWHILVWHRAVSWGWVFLLLIHFY